VILIFNAKCWCSVWNKILKTVHSLIDECHDKDFVYDSENRRQLKSTQFQEINFSTGYNWKHHFPMVKLDPRHQDGSKSFFLSFSQLIFNWRHFDTRINASPYSTISVRYFAETLQSLVYVTQPAKAIRYVSETLHWKHNIYVLLDTWQTPCLWKVALVCYQTRSCCVSLLTTLRRRVVYAYVMPSSTRFTSAQNI